MTNTTKAAAILNSIVLLIAGITFALVTADNTNAKHVQFASSVVQHDEHERVTVLPPLCEYEDGSGPNDSVCLWDAGVSGFANGGESFVVFHPQQNRSVYAYFNGSTEVFQD